MPTIIVQFITKLLSFTDGWKTFFSGIGLIGYAAYLAFSANPPNVDEAIKTFLAGLAVLGLGHKLAKNTAAQNVVDGPVKPEMLQKEPFSDGTLA